MATRYDLVIRGGMCVLPWGEEQVDVGVEDGRIVSLGVPPQAEAADVINAAGLHVLPGIIDPHVHLRDPGDASVETVATGTRAAVLGGVCTVIDMPNTQPAISSPEMLSWKQDYVEKESWCDIGLYISGTKKNTKNLGLLEKGRGVCSIKVFAAGAPEELLVEDDASLEMIMRSGRRRISFHSEDEYRVRARKAMFQAGDRHARHMEWRDVECAFLGTRRIIALAHKTNRPAHILHVSTAEEWSYLKGHRDIATAEVLVNHLTQVAPDCYDERGGYAVMNPPIRDTRHYEAAWAAVRDGTADTIGSDHAPHSSSAKELPWPDCAAGLTGVQTLLPIMLDHVNSGRLSLTRMADLMCAGPARVYGIAGKGRIAAGYDADFTLVDMAERRTIERSWIASPCGWTPFEGKQVSGWPVATIVRGQSVMRDDEILGEARGRLVVVH